MKRTDRLEEIEREHPSLRDEIIRLASVRVPVAGPIVKEQQEILIPRSESE